MKLLALDALLHCLNFDDQATAFVRGHRIKITLHFGESSLQSLNQLFVALCHFPLPEPGEPPWNTLVAE